MQWNRISEARLLDTRLADLPLRIEGSVLEERIDRLQEELRDRGIRFRIPCWLGSDWFSPDNVPGICIPFYLAHPRLMRLEKKFMFEVEGGSEHECLKILRHEAGHALDTAYGLHRKRIWREHFGPYSTPYPDEYQPRPNSRDFVLHLRAWYAQSHPAEDFAETFAVWLTPRSRWRHRYRDWPALHKLECVETLMDEVAGRPARNRRRAPVEALKDCDFTLREYYDRKREKFAVEWPAFHDRDLHRIFSDDPRDRKRTAASSVLRSLRREAGQLISVATGVHPYTINHVLEHLMHRCRDLQLRQVGSMRATRDQVLVLLSARTMSAIHTGRYRFGL